MGLAGVTITGADDLVDPAWLTNVTLEFPFVEWGVLIAPKRQGQCARYPAIGWIERFCRHVPRYHAAAHLCGQAARDVLVAGDAEFIDEALQGFGRIQLNGFSDRAPTPALASALDPARGEFILQATNIYALGLAEGWALAGGHRNVSALFDPSGGRGIKLSTVQCTWKLKVGYAGGIDPENVRQVVADLSAANGESSFWIDMESGVRTGDRFDFDKVLSVLRQCAPLATPPTGPRHG